MHAAASIGESIFVLGGHSDKKGVEMYDSRSNTWMTITSMNEERFYFAAAICGDSIFAIGGNSSQTVEKLQIL